jgi:VanZ family protein
MCPRRSRLARYRGILPWLAVAGWMLVIFVLSSLPELGSGGSGNLRFGISKVAHVILYSILGILVAIAIKPGSRRWVWWTFVLCELYAVGDEIHQSFVPGRTPTDLDLVIDGVSALAACLATPGILRRLSRRGETGIEGGATEAG